MCKASNLEPKEEQMVIRTLQAGVAVRGGDRGNGRAGADDL